MWVLLGCLLVNLFATQVQADAFCSIEDLKLAVEIDREVASAISKWNYLCESSTILMELMKTYLQEHQRMRHDELAMIVSNPLNAFQIIRRIVLNLPQIQEHLPKSVEGESFLSELETLRIKANLTLMDDLHGAAKGLVRIQFAQHLFACDLAEGQISTFNTTAKLSLYDCIFIANVARESHEFDTAAEWAECAQNLAKDLKDPLATTTVALLLESIKIHHDESPYDAENTEKPSRRFPLPIRGSDKTAKEHRGIYFKKIDNEKFDRFAWWEQDRFSYECALCRGKRFLTAEEESKLFCIQEGFFHPYFYLQPVKFEVQSLDPEVVNVHDFLRSSDIDLLKTRARDLLHRSVVGTLEGHIEISPYRISKTAWLEDYYDERIERISRRIGLITGMNTNVFAGDAEPFQVVNYGIAGQYYHHHDFLVEDNVKDSIYNDTHSSGDRIATFLIYLSDVPLGGATAFLSAGVAVQPVQGSATFWYNLYSNGAGNTKTYHAGCPVIYGSKWIANKWFREKGQMFKKPCGINDVPPKQLESEE